MHVSGLFIYPVKSLRGLSITSVEMDRLGMAGDRRFMVVDEKGRFLTQRALPRMALIATELTRDSLILSAAGHGSARVSLLSDPSSPMLHVSVWSSVGLLAENCGDTIAEWLSAFLGVRCRLVRAGSQFHRSVEKPGKARVDDVLGFADAFPVLIISEASLANLNDRLLARGEEAVPMDRFRPNIVIADCDAFAEDTWPRIRAGGVSLRAGGPCARCVVTTIDQHTAERGKEPLRTLATYRRDAADPTNINFGQNFMHETKSGTIMVSAAVEVLP
jgi:uncharacterized protein